MSIEQISGGYSPDVIYGRLTSPFNPKNITVNAHTPYDEETEPKVIHLKDFVGKKKTSIRVNIEKDDVETIGYSRDKKEDTKVEFPPKLKTNTGNVNNFTASAKSKDIVKGALQKGYSTEEAIVIARAKEAYSKSAGITKNPIGVLGGCNYRINS